MPRLFHRHAAHAACSHETCPQTGQLSSPSRSVATSSGGQQRGHRLNPNSPPSVAWAIRRSFSTSRRNFPKPAGASPVAESFSRAARTFSETTVIERSAECRASMSHDTRLNALSDDPVAVVCRFCEIADLRLRIPADGSSRRDWMLGRVTRARFTRLASRYRWRHLIDVDVKIRDLSRSSDIFQTIEPSLPI